MTKEKPLDPRIRRTRYMIRDALIALMDEKGMEAITVKDITLRADINRATFYAHYRDKYDLLEQSTNEMIEAFKKTVSSNSENRGERCWDAENSGRSLVSQFDHIGENASFYRVMLGENGIPGFWARLTKEIRHSFYEILDEMRPETNTSGIPKDLLITYVTSAHLGLIKDWLERGMPYTPKYLAGQLHAIVTLGPMKAAGLG